jgi:hypothetical protein
METIVIPMLQKAKAEALDKMEVELVYRRMYAEIEAIMQENFILYETDSGTMVLHHNMKDQTNISVVFTHIQKDFLKRYGYEFRLMNGTSWDKDKYFEFYYEKSDKE